MDSTPYVYPPKGEEGTHLRVSAFTNERAVVGTVSLFSRYTPPLSATYSRGLLVGRLKSGPQNIIIS